MNRFRVYGLTCALLMIAVAASATTIVLPTDEQLVAKSPLIVEGTVVSSGPVERSGSIWTETVIAVTRTLKGSAAQTIRVVEPGGLIGEQFSVVYGTPEYKDGENVLLFLAPNARGEYRTVDLFVGKFARGTLADGRRLWLRDVASNVNLLDAGLQPLPTFNIQRLAAGFESFVSERTAGREGARNYIIENPVLARGDARTRNVASDFTMIAEPTVYRWYAFDNGGSAPWFSNGTQPGYSDGGLSEIRTAMAAWTGYTGARINYVFNGARSGAPGGLEIRNSINEVTLNDPLNEITGTWNRNTGGVVGQGGFNGVTSGSTFTATFAADAAHPAGSIRAFNITEGNLVIQDGVSPANGISSSRLAEIISHEFGHTLGFGHSEDPNALMFATVSGLGPSLRDDDRTGARWLYPTGSGGGGNPQPTTPPSAPSALSASVSGNSVTLQWTDNATNESTQSIYVGGATGAFEKVGDVPAGSTSAQVNGFSFGTYRLYVTARNAAGESPASNTVTVSILQQVTAGFSFTPQSGTAGVTTFTFYDESSGPVTSRTWNFGDGTSSTSSVANHVYAASGVYTVTLTVAGGGTQSLTTKNISVAGPLRADFEWTPSPANTTNPVEFRDRSTGGVTSWNWTFGDGGTSSAQNPSYRFARTGVFNVTLQVTRNSETSLVQKSVSVSDPSPQQIAVVALFEATPLSPATGSLVSFRDRSSGGPTSWSWAFGDGATSTQQNPTHVFTVAGNYTVRLSVANAETQSTVTQTLVVGGSTATFEALISASAMTSGVGGTSWRTELNLFNAGTGAFVDFTYMPNGGGVQTRRMFVGPQQSLNYQNVLSDLFGLTTGAGAIALRSTGTIGVPQLKVSSRTYTNGAVGTYGQGVPAVQAHELSQTLYLTGMQSGPGYRTNVGLVNRADATSSATLTLVDRAGVTVATASVQLSALKFEQHALATLFPAVGSRTFDVLSMRIDASGANTLSVYASVVDNQTQDPIYIQAVPLQLGSTVTLPAVGRAPGANNTFWRSDVTLYNPTSSRQTMTLSYLPAGGDNRNAVQKVLSLSAGTTEVLADILASFDIASGSGAMDISWAGGVGPVVTSRTYTTAASGGTYGQSIDPVHAFASEVHIPGLRAESRFRSNVGFVNSGTSPITIAVKLISEFGAEVGQSSVQLPPKSQQQYALAALFPAANAGGTFTVYAVSASGNLAAYGSMVDNQSADPVFFPGR